MDGTLLRSFQLEVMTQCKFALFARRDLEEAWGEWDKAIAAQEWDVFDQADNRFWYSVQAFLVAAANLSKLLWANTRKADELRAELRRILDVPNDSPLKGTAMRNHFEHFDERLAKGAVSSKSLGVMIPKVFNRGKTMDGKPMRSLNRVGWTLAYNGDVLSLQPVFDAVQTLSEKVTVVLFRDDLCGE